MTFTRPPIIGGTQNLDPHLFDTVTFRQLAKGCIAVPAGTVPKLGPLPASIILERIGNIASKCNKQQPVRQAGNGYCLLP